MPLKIIPSGGALAAEIAGLDLAVPLPEACLSEIAAAWHRHLVLLFRGQELSAEQLIAFGRQFGPLHATEGVAYGAKPADTPAEIEIISNQPEDAVPEGARPSDEATWHSDMSMFEDPAAASIAYAVEVPSATGQIRFANLYRAYDTLPGDLEQAVRGRRSIHDAAYTAMGEVRGGYKAVSDRSQGPGARHPVLRRHPETGRTALFLGRKGYGYIEGYSVAQSNRLLDRLWRHMTQAAFVWTHEWRNGDLVMWDNRCCAHMRGAFDPGLRRRLLRVTVVGERPVEANEAIAVEGALL
nr:TauD/TfdA family dioxygenase [Desulfuromonadales bacterium]